MHLRTTSPNYHNVTINDFDEIQINERIMCVKLLYVSKYRHRIQILVNVFAKKKLFISKDQ